MRTRAAVLWEQGEPWRVETIDLEPPKAGEVLVKMAAAGLCHSDEHFVTGDMVPPKEVRDAWGMDAIYPMIGGHEGAGVVLEVGPGVTTVAPGDHVSTSFIPSCGRCRWCITGRSNLCDLGASFFAKGQITDGTCRHFCNGQELGTMAKVGTFSERTVCAENSLVKVDPDLPFPVVALVSCGVATGWGSAVHRAQVKPGETVVVIGVGGVGINVVQGARMMSARYVVAVDPVEFKQKTALDLGATHAVASIEAAIPLVTELTAGVMAERVIMAPGLFHGELLLGGLQLTAKDGTCVVTGIAPWSQNEASINLFELAMWQKEVKGVVFGACNPRYDIPNLLSLYRGGELKLDELITQTYSLDQVNDGYADMRDGNNIRGVLVFD